MRARCQQMLALVGLPEFVPTHLVTPPPRPPEPDPPPPKLRPEHKCRLMPAIPQLQA